MLDDRVQVSQDVAVQGPCCSGVLLLGGGGAPAALSGQRQPCRPWRAPQPRPPAPIRHCQGGFYERAKNHQPDISTGSQKGSFTGHYGAEQRAV